MPSSSTAASEKRRTKGSQRRNLDGSVTVQPRVERPIYLTHACRIRSRNDLVRASFVPEATVIGARNYNPVRQAAVDATTLADCLNAKSARSTWCTKS